MRAGPAMRIVLLVEDNPDDNYLVSDAFEDLLPDLLLKVAKHADEAIAYLSGRGLYSNRREYPLPSLLMLDLGLPRRSGLELLGWVRKDLNLAGLPVVVFTGPRRKADAGKAAALGVDACFTKPVNFRELAAFVRNSTGHAPREPAVS